MRPWEWLLSWEVQPTLSLLHLNSEAQPGICSRRQMLRPLCPSSSAAAVTRLAPRLHCWPPHQVSSQMLLIPSTFSDDHSLLSLQVHPETARLSPITCAKPLICEFWPVCTATYAQLHALFCPYNFMVWFHGQRSSLLKAFSVL